MTLGSSGNCTFRGTMSTEIFTLSLHDALPISKVLQTVAMEVNQGDHRIVPFRCDVTDRDEIEVMIGNVIEVDRKSTRLNSSHTVISYAVFCLKKQISSGRQASGRSAG